MWKRVLDECIKVGVTQGYLFVALPKKRQDTIIKEWCRHHDNAEELARKILQVLK